ncbi:MAG: hypothetical protein LBH90_03190, partial [Tannerella sp.]|nr:hypothetical protein [Tannerella sp.]
MLENVEIRELAPGDIHGALLDGFDRHQRVTRSWVNEGGNWVLADRGYVVDWDKDKKSGIVQYVSDMLCEKTGFVFGAYEN